MSDDHFGLTLLAEPFPSEDVEWRILAAGLGRKAIWAKAVAFITARAIQQRLDDVCGVNWRIEEPKILVVNGQSAFAVGISIRIDNEWRTRWDVGDATSIEPAKGGFSSALKRAGCAWSIGRLINTQISVPQLLFLYRLPAARHESGKYFEAEKPCT